MRNPTIVANANRILNLKSGEFNDVELYPIVVVDDIAKSFGSSKATSGSQTMFTTPTDKDFYLHSVTYSYSKDAACDAAAGITNGVAAVIQGVTQWLVNLAHTALIQQSDSIHVVFPKPIKLDRNSAITIGNMTYTAGSCIRVANISYSVQETTTNQVV